MSSTDPGGQAEPGPAARDSAAPQHGPRPAGWGGGAAEQVEARILILEDDMFDAELEQRLLTNAGLVFQAQVVDNKAAFIQQLAEFRPDVILSDFSLPGFSGESALRITRERDPHVPFILLSGALGEESAVEFIRQGVTDYVLKDRPARLALVVRRALREAQQAAQQARLEAQLQQSRRLESLGQLAGGVAHDFNNLLGVISSYSSFVREEVAREPARIEWESVRADIGQIDTAVQRAIGLTRQLLAFGRREVAQPRVLTLNEEVSSITTMLVRTIGDHIELNTVLAQDLLPVLADPSQIEQVLINLAVNARDAMPAGGTLTIDTANTQVDDEFAALRANLQPGRYAMVRVSDTGTGMPPEVLDQVFEPFFTTKPNGHGTGLGLATVHGIVTRAGGGVRIYSEPGLGTTVTVLLPVTDQAPAPAVPPSERALGGAGKTVLVVEDEAALREVTRRMLDRHGFRVLTAASGREALELVGQHGRLDLLITDVVMPHMLGREVADHIRAVQPDISILFMSGYANGLLSAQGILEPGLHLIEKPFTQASLLTKLAEVLDQAPG